MTLDDYRDEVGDFFKKIGTTNGTNGKNHEE